MVERRVSFSEANSLNYNCKQPLPMSYNFQESWLTSLIFFKGDWSFVQCYSESTQNSCYMFAHYTDSCPVVLWAIYWCNSHYNDVIMSAVASQITSLTIVYLTFSSRRRSGKTSKLRVTGLCAGNSPAAGEFPAQMASNAENVSLWWRHHNFAHVTTAVQSCCVQNMNVLPMATNQVSTNIISIFQQFTLFSYLFISYIIPYWI